MEHNLSMQLNICNVYTWAIQYTNKTHERLNNTIIVKIKLKQAKN